MKKGIKFLLVIYTIATLSSIAVMEMVSVLLTLMALGTWSYDYFYNKKTVKWNWDTFNVSLILFNVLALLSLLVSPLAFSEMRMEPAFAIVKISAWYYSLGYLLNKVSQPEDYQKWLKLCLGVILITSLYTIFQFFTGVDFIRGTSKVLPSGSFFRPTGFFSMSLTLAYCLGMASVFLLPFIDFYKGTKKQFIFTGIFLISVIAVILSLSRGVWIGIIGSSALVLLFIRSKYILILLGVCSIVLVCFLGFNQTVQQKLIDLFDPNISSNHFRLTLWHAYWTMFKEHWVLGVGWLQNEFLLDQYLVQLGYEKFEFRSHAHSNIFQVLSGMGLLGILAYLGMLVGGLKRSWNLVSTNKTQFASAMGLALLGSQVLFHLGGFTECNFTDAEVSHMLFSQWALLSVFNHWNV